MKEKLYYPIRIFGWSLGLVSFIFALYQKALGGVCGGSAADSVACTATQLHMHSLARWLAFIFFCISQILYFRDPKQNPKTRLIKICGWSTAFLMWLFLFTFGT
jgi:hypothetical protein